MISTGIKGLDEVISGLRTGDNVVWQIDNIKDYKGLVKSCAREALKEKKKLIYLRFASHGELLKPSEKVKRYELNANVGFESFTTRVHNIIGKEGEGAYYVFDCLSELLSAWATDLMISNFFMVTCPYLYELKTIAYFSILRNSHSYESIARIRETTQILIDVYNRGESFYIHPLKVWNRYSPTMFLPHKLEKDMFLPVADSINASKLLAYIGEKGADSAKRKLDYWDRLFLDAEGILKKKPSKSEVEATVRKLCKIMITKNEKMLSLATKNFMLKELIEIKSRLIGTGFIGGKTVGMLLARKILSEEKTFDFLSLTEPHDSFYVGSDIYYSYIVQNHLWRLRMQQKTEDGYLKIARILKEKMLYGTFSDDIMERFQRIIEYFGASPIIIRSSSLLEDSFGNAFAGKYESIFLANQGTPEQRYIQFAEAVKKIYASTMSEDALVYRKQRGLDELDEQMALLVQRVSGSYHKHYFFPDLAGVGFSHNTYVWNENMDPEAGMLRLVFGLGSRAVNRVEGDYPRMVALDEPLRKPYSEMGNVRQFSQHEVDLINTKANLFESKKFMDLVKERIYENLRHVAIKDFETERMMREKGRGAGEHWILTLDNIFKDASFVASFRKMLKILERRYHYPVEIEFTVNFTTDDTFKINLLQCRPLQTQGLGPKAKIPDKINKKDMLFSSCGHFMGGNISQKVKNVIYIAPDKYTDLSLTEKYEVARIIGQLNRNIRDRDRIPTVLIGPGRWGTSTPSLGVPVKFAEINNFMTLVELGFSAGNLMPELSFGTHFFQDLVETNIFYVSIFPDKGVGALNEKWFSKENDIFARIVPDAARYKDIIHLYDTGGKGLRIMSDVVSRKVICFSGSKRLK